MRTTQLLTITLAALGCSSAVVGCSSETRNSGQAESDVSRLVREYLRRDGLGEFRGHSEWLSDNVTFEPAGYDQGVIVQTARIIRTSVEGDSGAVDVQYSWVGVLGVDSLGRSAVFPADSVELVRFTLERTQEGWKIAGPDLPVHVEVRTVLQIPTLSAEEQARLQALLASRP